ncbi:MAG: hypothetical protein M9890_13205, partial [Thermomicrobiales bacterium]|nr:hypothetical protein [Thermomicrobiales bacterium]
AAIAARAEKWPETMNASSTHDTKRSEDVRARIAVLSELVDDWADHVARWRDANRRYLRDVDGVPAPEGNTEYLIYQTLIGAWPIGDADRADFAGRIKRYLEKAGREAKQHTSWINQNVEYEAAVAGFVDAILASDNHAFLDDFLPFQREVAWYGALNSLAQLAIKATAPGVPDFYQGTELWDLSLVDPDNRRPVDFAQRTALLDQLESADVAALLADWSTGAVKLLVTQKLARHRRSLLDLFAGGEYLPLEVAGERRRHVVAFARRSGDVWSITVVPRLLAGLARATGFAAPQAPLGAQAWGNTRVLLPNDAPSGWGDVLTGARHEASDTLPLASLLDRFPLAVLAGESVG